MCLKTLLRSLNRIMRRKRPLLALFIMLSLGGIYLINNNKIQYESPEPLHSTQASLQAFNPQHQNIDQLNMVIQQLPIITDSADTIQEITDTIQESPPDQSNAESNTATIVVKPDPDNLSSNDHGSIIDNNIKSYPDLSINSETDSMASTIGDESTHLDSTVKSETDSSNSDSDATVSNTQSMDMEELNRLDDLYNMHKVVDVDLHNLTFLDNYYHYNYEAIEKRISDRMLNVQKVCQTNPPSSYYNLYQINELNVTWCPVFKSGSTTWKNYFIDKFIKDPPEEHLLNLLKPRLLSSSSRLPKKGGKQLYKLENERNIRFTVVRHPLDRLVSHVKNSGKDQEMVNQRGIWIQSAMLAGRTSKINNQSDERKFKAEFDHYFAWLKAGQIGVFNKSSDNPYLNPPVPLLPELVNHMMTKRSANGHWMPAQQFCNICNNKFDYIIKLEEEPLELWYLVEKLGKTFWDDRLYFLNRANNSSEKLTELVKVWDNLKNLSDKQIDFINKHFAVDLKMFDYKTLEKL